MAGKLILSSSSDMDFPLDKANLVKNIVIHFNYEFNLFKVTTTSATLTTILTSEVLSSSYPIF